MTCSECKWWVMFPGDMGECMRRSPILPIAGISDLGIWPKTAGFGGCGDFEPRPLTDEEFLAHAVRSGAPSSVLDGHGRCEISDFDEFKGKVWLIWTLAQGVREGINSPEACFEEVYCALHELLHPIDEVEEPVDERD